MAKAFQHGPGADRVRARSKKGPLLVRAHPPNPFEVRRARALLPAADGGIVEITTLGRAAGAASNSTERARARQQPSIHRTIHRRSGDGGWHRSGPK